MKKLIVLLGLVVFANFCNSQANKTSTPKSQLDFFRSAKNYNDCLSTTRFVDASKSYKTYEIPPSRNCTGREVATLEELSVKALANIKGNLISDWVCVVGYEKNKDYVNKLFGLSSARWFTCGDINLPRNSARDGLNNSPTVAVHGLVV